MADTNLIYPYEFEGGKKAVASEVNANFEAIKAFSNGVNATFDDIKSAITDLKKKPTREMFDIYYSFSAEAPIGAYPLWTGETIVNCKTLYPQFWKKLNDLVSKSMLSSVSLEEYNEKLETYGQCASFYVDTLNGHVRLPKITRFISSIEDLTQLAEEQNDVNKEHTHKLKAYTGSGNKNASEDRYLGSGTDNSKSDRFWSDVTDIENTAVVVSEGEEEAHPKNIRLCLYLQVANNIGEISELDVDAIITQMNEALTSLEVAFNDYYNRLTELYTQIKVDIVNSSPVIKEEQITITPDMFFEDTTYAEYPYAVDVVVEDATEESVPTVNLALEQTQSGNYAPVAYSGNGYVRIYAKEAPEAEFVIPSIVLQ